MAKCKACNTEVHWAKSRKTGKPAPIEAKTHPQGNVVLHDDRTYEVLGKGKSAGNQVTHMNHFATCPGREQFR